MKSYVVCRMNIVQYIHPLALNNIIVYISLYNLTDICPQNIIIAYIITCASRVGQVV